MKKVVFILLTLVLVLCFVSCEIIASNENESEIPEAGKKTNSHIYIWTDEKTGVQYIVYSDVAGYGGMGGITPRLNADGTLYVSTENEDTKGE